MMVMELMLVVMFVVILVVGDDDDAVGIGGDCEAYLGGACGGAMML